MSKRYFYQHNPLSLLVFVIAFFLSGCASLPTLEKHEPQAIPDASETFIYQETQKAMQLHLEQSGFLALDDGIDALAARLAVIKSAEATIDIQYYIWHDDMVGRIMHNQLLAAADRGVKVRLLLDDLDTAGKDDILALINHHPNIDIRLFNPFPNRDARWKDFLTSTSRVNRRMHNKTITVDRSFSIMGGRNIGDEYFNASLSVGFSDMDVIAIGPVTEQVEESFSRYWNSDWSYPLDTLVDTSEITDEELKQFKALSDQYLESAESSPYSDALKSRLQEKYTGLKHDAFAWGRWKLFYDQPSKVRAEEVNNDQHIAPHLISVMDQVKSDLVIVSPYFVPGKKFTKYLVDKVSSGVRVRVLTNSLAANDVQLVHAGYRRYRRDLLEGGVELYEFKPTVDPLPAPQKPRWTGSSRASLHGKYLGFDSSWVFVGSFNLDGRSVALNTEIAVLFESERYGEFLAENFDRYAYSKGYRLSLDDDGDLQWNTLEGGDQVSYDHEPETSAWTRFWNRVLSVFVPESQL